MPSDKPTPPPNQSWTHRPTAGPNPAPHSDEISLIEIWKVLERRRWWLIGIACLVTLAGSAYGTLQTPNHEFRTVIDVPDVRVLGQVSVQRNHQGRETITIDYPHGMSSRLLEPSLLANDVQEGIGAEIRDGQTRESGLNLDIRQKEGSRYWIVFSRAPEQSESAAREWHQRAVPAILEAINAELETLRAPIEARIREIKHVHQSTQSGLDHQRAILSRKIEGLDRRLALLDERAALVQQHQEAAKARPEDNQPFTPPNGDWTQLLAHIQTLDRTATTVVPEERETLAFQLDQARDQLQRVSLTREMDQQRFEAAYTETESMMLALSGPQVRGNIGAMSADPVDDQRSLIVALSVVLGLMLGVFGAFFREFLANVRAAEGQ